MSVDVCVNMRGEEEEKRQHDMKRKREKEDVYKKKRACVGMYLSRK